MNWLATLLFAENIGINQAFKGSFKKSAIHCRYAIKKDDPCIVQRSSFTWT